MRVLLWVRTPVPEGTAALRQKPLCCWYAGLHLRRSRAPAGPNITEQRPRGRSDGAQFCSAVSVDSANTFTGEVASASEVMASETGGRSNGRQRTRVCPWCNESEVSHGNVLRAATHAVHQEDVDNAGARAITKRNGLTYTLRTAQGRPCYAVGD